MKRWVVLALCGTSVGCALMGEYGSKNRLIKAVEAHGDTLRWGGGSGLEALRHGRRVTNVEVKQVALNEDRDRATVRLAVEGYAMPQMVLRQWIYEQTWEDRSNGWVLVKEKELKPQGTRDH